MEDIWLMTHDSSTYGRHDSSSTCRHRDSCVAWLIRMCGMSNLYAWHDSSICVICLILMYDMTPLSHMDNVTHIASTYGRHDSSFTYGGHDSSSACRQRAFLCGTTHSYVWHDSFICVTWLIHMCDVTYSYVWHDSFIFMRDMTHSYVWHDSIICVTRLIHICDKTHSYVWHTSFICVTWLIHMCDMSSHPFTSSTRVLHLHV